MVRVRARLGYTMAMCLVLTTPSKPLIYRASNAYLLLVPLFSSFMGSMVCHTLPLFGKSMLGIISFDFMIPSLVHCLCFLFRSCLLLRWSAPSTISHLLKSAMPHPPVLTTICGCVTDFIAFFYKGWRKCVHIYIYIQTLAQNWTAVIKISCLAQQLHAEYNFLDTNLTG